MGVSPDRSLSLHPYAQQLIRLKAPQLVGKAGFRRADVPDIRQDMLLYLHEHSEAYDPDRGAATTFIARLVDKWIAMALRDRGRHKRAGGFTLRSIDVTVVGEDGHPTALSNLLPESVREGITAKHQGESRSAEDHEALQLIAASLPATLREIFARLQHRSVVGVATDMNISRRELAKHIECMRRRFEDGGFEKS